MLPSVGSVPAPELIKYCEVGRLCLDVKYLTNSTISPLKLLMIFPSAGKKEKTWLTPLEPLYNFQLLPASVTVAIGTGLPSAPCSRKKSATDRKEVSGMMSAYIAC